MVLSTAPHGQNSETLGANCCASLRMFLLCNDSRPLARMISDSLEVEKQGKNGTTESTYACETQTRYLDYPPPLTRLISHLECDENGKKASHYEPNFSAPQFEAVLLKALCLAVQGDMSHSFPENAASSMTQFKNFIIFIHS